MNICQANGWTENNRPECSWCRNPIGVRGDVPSNAVLTGEILLTIAGGKVTRVAHFDCERHIWRSATNTEAWWERIFGGTKLVLMSFRSEWVQRQPWYVGA